MPITITPALLNKIKTYPKAELRLAQRNFTDEMLPALVEAINANPKIQTLNLQNNLLVNPVTLKRLSHVKKIDLSYNNIDDTGATTLASLPFKMDLTCNNISEAGLEMLSKIIGEEDSSKPRIIFEKNPGSHALSAT